MRAKVDAETCIACGLCVEICPEVFELDDEGIARAKTDAVPPEQESAARDAAEQCPVDAIEIEE